MASEITKELDRKLLELVLANEEGNLIYEDAVRELGIKPGKAEKLCHTWWTNNLARIKKALAARDREVEKAWEGKIVKEGSDIVSEKKKQRKAQTVECESV